MRSVFVEGKLIRNKGRKFILGNSVSLWFGVTVLAKDFAVEPVKLIG